MSSAAPHILCIAGSPRRRGNSEQLLDACMNGIQSAGGTAEKLVASESGVAPCQGCNGCAATGKCVFHDAMYQVYPKLDSADGIVVATPVFFATVPAVLKILMDRTQPYWARRYRLGEETPRRPGAILVAAAGGSNPFGVECAVKPLRSVFGVLNLDVLDVLEVSGVDVPSDMKTHPEALERAAEIGAEVARAAAQH